MSFRAMQQLTCEAQLQPQLTRVQLLHGRKWVNMAPFSALAAMSHIWMKSHVMLICCAH